MPVRAPVTKPSYASRKTGRAGPDIGRQVCPETSEANGSPEVSQGTERPRAGESGVGRNAGPICIVAGLVVAGLVKRTLPVPVPGGGRLHRESPYIRKRNWPYRMVVPAYASPQFPLGSCRM